MSNVEIWSWLFVVLATRVAPVVAVREPREIEGLFYEAIDEIIDEFPR